MVGRDMPQMKIQ